MNKKDSKKRLNITIKRQRLELLRTIAFEEGWNLEELINNYYFTSKNNSDNSDNSDKSDKSG